MNTKAIIVDIDGTVADLSHRLHFIQQTPKDWDSFHAAAKYDDPIHTILDLVKCVYQAGATILFVTGRTNRLYSETRDWLEFHGINMNSLDIHLFMRKHGDYRSDTVIKKEIYDEKIAGKYDVQFVLEDRSSVVNMWRHECELTCLQVKDGDY